MTQPQPVAELAFSNLGLSTKILSILEQNSYFKPTPIQARTIPLGLEGKDIIGIAQTGTGKTLAFSLPMLQNLSLNHGQGLILVPTRELALQVEETLQKVGRPFGLKIAVIIGGAPMHQQTVKLRARPHVVVATPGRLMDHIEHRTIGLDQMKVVVLDEADRMFDIGFAPQIKRILSIVPKDRQTLLFSATMPPAIAAIGTQFMKSPVRVEVAPAGTSATQVEQRLYMVSKMCKLQLLELLLRENPGTVLVFTRTKFGAKKLNLNLRHLGHTAAEIHSNRSLAQRRQALDGFKSGAYRVLVATDIAARGIDVTGITLVVNYDLPDNPEDYVHRIGRTARAGRSGLAITFATAEERNDIRGIERVIRKSIPTFPLPVLPNLAPMPAVHRGGDESHRRPMQHRSSGGRSSSSRGGHTSSSGGYRHPGANTPRSSGSSSHHAARPPHRSR